MRYSASDQEPYQNADTRVMSDTMPGESRCSCVESNGMTSGLSRSLLLTSSYERTLEDIYDFSYFVCGMGSSPSTRFCQQATSVFVEGVGIFISF